MLRFNKNRYPSVYGDGSVFQTSHQRSIRETNITVSREFLLIAMLAQKFEVVIARFYIGQAKEPFTFRCSSETWAEPVLSNRANYTSGGFKYYKMPEGLSSVPLPIKKKKKFNSQANIAQEKYIFYIEAAVRLLLLARCQTEDQSSVNVSKENCTG